MSKAAGKEMKTAVVWEKAEERFKEEQREWEEMDIRCNTSVCTFEGVSALILLSHYTQESAQLFARTTKQSAFQSWCTHHMSQNISTTCKCKLLGKLQRNARMSVWYWAGRQLYHHKPYLNIKPGYWILLAYQLLKCSCVQVWAPRQCPQTLFLLD